MDVKGSKAQGGNEDDAMLFDRIAREQKKRKKCSEKGTENAEWGHENFYVQKGIPLWLVLAGWFRRSGQLHGQLVKSTPKSSPSLACVTRLLPTGWYVFSGTAPLAGV